MSKRKNNQRGSSKLLRTGHSDKTGASEPLTQEATAVSDSNEPNNSLPWSKTSRRIASIAIVSYLAILLIGPLSNPIGSQHFSVPIAGKVGPIHRALFLGHGYRFFAPDPGPTHRLLYQGVRADGTEFSGHFPDRENNWPRLLYHRWFMLSETLFNEQSLKPSVGQFEQRQTEYERQILRLQTEGKRELLEQLVRERELEASFFETSTHRVELLAKAVANVLLQRNEGQSIELFVQERRIPFPEEVADGLRLDAESLLSDPIKIGELDADGFRIPKETETLQTERLPAKEDAQ